ncbi:hypothetical protein Trydic_g7820 [Trypoxylus dichotomus]
MEEKEKLLIENSNNTIVYKYLHMFLITSVVQVWLKVTLQHQNEAVVLESFCEAATSVATSIDCCKTSVRVTYGMVSNSSIILLEVLVPGPRAITCNTFYRSL